MDHINSVRAALKAASVKGTPPPVLAIPIPGRAPVCIRTQLLKGALKGVTIDSVKLLEDGRLKITGRALTLNKKGHSISCVGTSCTFVPIERWKALQEIREWSIREHEKRVKIINQGVLSAQMRRELLKKSIEGEADEVLTEARKDEALIMAAARSHANPAMAPVSDEARERVIESYAAFHGQRGNRKRGAVIRWKLAKLRKDKAAMVKVQHVYDEVPSTLYRRRHKTLKSKVTVLRRKKDAVKYAALIYQIGRLEKQYESLYPPKLHVWFDGSQSYNVDSWINNRPKDQTVNTKDWWRSKDKDRYDRKDEARKLKEARANIRALTPPADEAEELSQAA
jgi:hypothetical protein